MSEIGKILVCREYFQYMYSEIEGNLSNDQSRNQMSQSERFPYKYNSFLIRKFYDIRALITLDRDEIESRVLAKL